MVSTILAVIRISVEGGATSKIGEARFWERGLTRSPPKFLKDFPTRIFKKRKKMAGEDPLDPLTGGITKTATVGIKNWFKRGQSLVLLRVGGQSLIILSQ